MRRLNTWINHHFFTFILWTSLFRYYYYFDVYFVQIQRHEDILIKRFAISSGLGLYCHFCTYIHIIYLWLPEFSLYQMKCVDTRNKKNKSSLEDHLSTIFPADPLRTDGPLLGTTFSFLPVRLWCWVCCLFIYSFIQNIKDYIFGQLKELRGEQWAQQRACSLELKLGEECEEKG